MQKAILLVLVFGGIVGLFALLAVVMERLSRPRRQERWAAGARRAAPAAPEPAKLLRRRRRPTYSSTLVARIVRPLSALWRLGDTTQSRLQEMLVHAGIREKGAVEVFLGAKFALAVALPTAVIAFFLWRSHVRGTPINYRHLFMYSASALAMGLLIPNIWLRNKAKARIERIRYSLPDALDLLIVCIESGLGLDAALVRISREMVEAAPDLCEELTLLNLEISAGKPREECLRNLALRTGCDEVESLVARINQSARFGTNLGNSLRIHSESLRQKRRQEAEERAAKTSVKLLFPLVFFIFPAMFVVILGPALVKISRIFG